MSSEVPNPQGLRAPEQCNSVAACPSSLANIRKGRALMGATKSDALKSDAMKKVTQWKKWYPEKKWCTEKRKRKKKKKDKCFKES
jgi:hypothetical protein